MATKLFFRQALTASPYQWSSGTNSAKLDTTNAGWKVESLATTAGSGVHQASQNTVAGPTNGIEMTDGAFDTPVHWISAPLDADVTISGTITLNLWASETTMSDNAAINAVIDRIDSTGAIVSQIAKTARTTELGFSGSNTVANFTVTPTSTAMNKGDRIRVRVFGDDAGTMAATGAVQFGYDGGTAAADGDSYVSFTETFGFLTSDPSTATLYPTTTTSDIDPGGAGTDTKEAWTSRGSGSTNAVTNTAAGWTAPIQSTVSAGGNLVEWFSKQLTAFTLVAPVLVNVRALESNAAANASVRAELAVTASDGTSATVWAATSHPTELTISDAAYTFYLAADDLAITDGQRFRLRLYLDDSAIIAMGASQTVTVSYAGTSGGASGDTYLTFGQTLTEFVTSTDIYQKRPTVTVPGIPGRALAGPPMLAVQRFPDFTGPSTIAVDVATAGAITFTGQSLALSQAQSVTAGAVTFTGQAIAFTIAMSVTAGQMTFTGANDLTLIVDVPHPSTVYPKLTLRLGPRSVRGPPLLRVQRFDSYVAQAVTTTVDVSTAGAFTLTGSDVAFTQTQSVVAGSMTFTGQSVGVVSTVNVGTAGAMTFTGQSVGLSQAQSVTAGQMTFTGQSGATVLTINVGTAGLITFTGQSVTVATVSSVTTAGQVTFTGQSVPTTNTINVDAGAVTFSGATDITLVTTAPTVSPVHPLPLALKIGAFGPPILVRQRFDSYAAFTILNVDTAGAITFTGQGVAFTQTQSVTAGQVTFTGQSVAFTQSQSVSAGQMTFTGQSVTLITQTTVSTAGAVTFTGQTTPTTNTVNVDAGSVTFSGATDIALSVTQPNPSTVYPQLPSLKIGFRGPPILVRQQFNVPQALTTTVSVDTAGQVTFTGQSVGLTQSQSVTAGQMTFTGQSVAFRQSQQVNAGQVTFTGSQVSVTSTVAVTAGAVTFSGSQVSITKVAGVSGGLVTFSGSSVGVSVALSVTAGAITFTGSALTIVAPGAGVVRPIILEGRYSLTIYLQGMGNVRGSEGWGVIEWGDGWDAPAPPIVVQGRYQPSIALSGAYVPTITKRGVYRPSI